METFSSSTSAEEDSAPVQRDDLDEILKDMSLTQENPVYTPGQSFFSAIRSNRKKSKSEDEESSEDEEEVEIEQERVVVPKQATEKEKQKTWTSTQGTGIGATTPIVGNMPPQLNLHEASMAYNFHPAYNNMSSGYNVSLTSPYFGAMSPHGASMPPKLETVTPPGDLTYQGQMYSKLLTQWLYAENSYANIVAAAENTEGSRYLQYLLTSTASQGNHENTDVLCQVMLQYIRSCFPVTVLDKVNQANVNNKIGSNSASVVLPPVAYLTSHTTGNYLIQKMYEYARTRTRLQIIQSMNFEVPTTESNFPLLYVLLSNCGFLALQNIISFMHLETTAEIEVFAGNVSPLGWQALLMHTRGIYIIKSIFRLFFKRTKMELSLNALKKIVSHICRAHVEDTELPKYFRKILGLAAEFPALMQKDVERQCDLFFRQNRNYREATKCATSLKLLLLHPNVGLRSKVTFAFALLQGMQKKCNMSIGLFILLDAILILCSGDLDTIQHENKDMDISRKDMQLCFATDVGIEFYYAISHFCCSLQALAAKLHQLIVGNIKRKHMKELQKKALLYAKIRMGKLQKASLVMFLNVIFFDWEMTQALKGNDVYGKIFHELKDQAFKEKLSRANLGKIELQQPQPIFNKLLKLSKKELETLKQHRRNKSKTDSSNKVERKKDKILI
eukprot:g376.t1